MRAVYIEQFSGLDGLTVKDVETPLPKPGEVLVRVHAAGLNRADLLQAAGKYPPPAGYSPNIPGMEFAGEIVKLGEGVTGWSVGDRVWAITGGEAQAEFVVSPTELLIKIPDNLDYTQAAAFPEVFITAHDAIFTQSDLKSDETLLIHAVGSGVGLAALQMAKNAGATVIGTSRTSDKLERAKELGLDHGIVVGQPVEFAKRIAGITDVKGVNVILDLVGGGYFQENLAAVALKGRLIVVGLTSGRESAIDLGLLLAKRASIRGTTLRARSLAEKAAATHAFADVWKGDAQLNANVDRVFPVEDVREAYAYLASNASFGKVILTF